MLLRSWVSIEIATKGAFRALHLSVGVASNGTLTFSSRQIAQTNRPREEIS